MTARTITHVRTFPATAGGLAQFVREARVRHPADPYDRQNDMPRGARLIVSFEWDNPAAAMLSIMAGKPVPADRLVVTAFWTPEDEETEATIPTIAR